MPYPQSENGYWVFDTSGFPAVGVEPENLIEGFEDQTLDAYGGDVQDFTIQNNNVLKGRYSLQSQDSYVIIAGDDDSLETSREATAIEYIARLYLQDDGQAIFCTNVQDVSSPFQDCYAITVDTSGDELRFYKRENGNSVYIEREAMSLSTGVEYWPSITLTEEGINGALYDNDGSVLYQTDSYRDTTHQGGTFGWRSGSGNVAYFDHLVFEAGSMGDVSVPVIDDFEHNSLSQHYSWEGSTGTRSITSSAARSGSYGFEMDGYGHVISAPGDGLPNYPEPGDEFELYFNPVDDDPSTQFWFFFGSDTTNVGDYFTLEVIHEGGGSYSFRVQDPGGSTIASDYGMGSLTEGEWHRLYVDWHSNGTFDCSISEDGQSSTITELSVTRSLSGPSGIGYRSGGNGTLHVDDVIIL